MNPIKHTDIAEEGVLKDNFQKEVVETTGKIILMQTAIQNVAKELNKTFSGMKVETIGDIEKINEGLKKTHDLTILNEKANQALLKTSILQSKDTKDKLANEKEYNKQIENTEKNTKRQTEAQRKLNSEYEQGKIRLNEMNKELKDLAFTGQTTTKVYKDLLKAQQELDAKVRGAEHTAGQFQRDVGQYPDQKREIQEAKDAILELTGVGRIMGGTFGEISTKLRAFGTILSGLRNELKLNKEATELNTVATEKEKIVVAESAIAEDVETVSVEANTVAQKSNTLARLGWIGVAIAATAVLTKSIFDTKTANQDEKDSWDAKKEAAMEYFESLFNFNVNSKDIYKQREKEILDELKLRDLREEKSLQIQNLAKLAAVARDNAMQEKNTTKERIDYLNEFIALTNKEIEVKEELAKKDVELKKEAYEFELKNPNGKEREKKEALIKSINEERRIIEEGAQEKVRTDRMIGTLESKDQEDRLKLFNDSEKRKLEVLKDGAEKEKLIEKESYKEKLEALKKDQLKSGFDDSRFKGERESLLILHNSKMDEIQKKHDQKEAQYEWSVLEQELKMISEHDKKITDAKIKEDKRLRDEAQSDALFLAQFLNEQDEKEKAIKDKKSKEEKDTAQKVQGAITQGIENGLKERESLQQASDQKMLDFQTRMANEQAILAAGGKANDLAGADARAAKAEEKKLQDAKKAAKIQEEVTIITAFEKTLQTALSKGEPFGQAFGEAMASSGLVSAAFTAMFSGFYEGTEDTGTVNNPLDSKGGRVAIVHDNERVIPKYLNDKIKGISNEELVNNYTNGLYLPPSVFIDRKAEENYMLSKKLDAVISAIDNQPKQMIGKDVLGDLAEVIRINNISKTIHYKQGKPKGLLNGLR